MDPFASALELAAAIRAKEISPVEVVDGYLERTDRINPDINAVVWRRDEDLRREASQAEQAVMNGDRLGPFHGVPIPVKDLTDVTGWPTTYGSRAARDRVAISDADVVAAFKRAGFLLAFRTNTPEFGTLCVTENELFGATRNPWNTERIPGGSSGGSAAAVAAGLVPIGHANDGGGSIRIPASCCGVFGLKPTRGRVSMGPFVSDILHGLAVEGVVSRTVADTAAVLDAIATKDMGAWYNAPVPERAFSEEVDHEPARLRIAYTTDPPLAATVEPCCVDLVTDTAALLEELGHEVFEGAPAWPDPEQSLRTFMTVWNTGGALIDVSDWQQVERLNRAMHEASLATDSAAYVRAIAEMQVHSRIITASWGRDFDVLLTPTLVVEPPELGAIWEGYDEDPLRPLMTAAGWVPFTPLFNVTGQPAISLPLGTGPGGLPLGVQLVGAPWDEATLLGLSAQIERARPWSQRRPQGL